MSPKLAYIYIDEILLVSMTLSQYRLLSTRNTEMNKEIKLFITSI